MNKSRYVDCLQILLAGVFFALYVFEWLPFEISFPILLIDTCVYFIRAGYEKYRKKVEQKRDQ
jgi:hypothetical protein